MLHLPAVLLQEVGYLTFASCARQTRVFDRVGLKKCESIVTLSCRLYRLVPPIALHHEPSKSVEIIHGHTMGNEVDLTRWALSRRAAAVAWSRDEEPDAWEIEVDTPLHT